VKEGGPSDFTADVLHRIQNAYGLSGKKTKKYVHVIQHGPAKNALNEVYTNRKNLAFVKKNTHYIKMANGNIAGNGTAGLKNSNKKIIKKFMKAATSSKPKAWNAAFRYFQPLKNGNSNRARWKYHYLDFSDTVELLRIMGIGTKKVANVCDFAKVFFK
jgi:hypothetical protein